MIRALALVLSVSPAAAQERCGDWSRIALSLATDYGEQMAFTGLSFDKHVVEVWANPETGTWTVLTVTPDGKACIRDLGEAGGPAAPVKKGAPA